LVVQLLRERWTIVKRLGLVVQIDG
jgi:hypothetical protein